MEFETDISTFTDIQEESYMSNNTTSNPNFTPPSNPSSPDQFSEDIEPKILSKNLEIDPSLSNKSENNTLSKKVKKVSKKNGKNKLKKQGSGENLIPEENSSKETKKKKKAKKEDEDRTDVLAQPKRKRNKRYKLEKKYGFGSRSSRDLFFGLIPGEGADKHYLTHSKLEQKNAAQSAFKSKSFMNTKIPFGPLSDSAPVDLYHGQLPTSTAPENRKFAPFGTTEGKFQMYDWYHFSNRNPDNIAPGTYYNQDLKEDSKNSKSSPRVSIDKLSNRHPFSIAFQQKHKNFRSTSDLQQRKTSNLQGINRGSQSTANLPLHLVKNSTLKEVQSKQEPDINTQSKKSENQELEIHSDNTSEIMSDTTSLSNEDIQDTKN